MTNERAAVTDVVVVHKVDTGRGYGGIGIGDIERSEGGRLVTAWREDFADRTDMGDVLYSVSDDNGKTWSEARVMLDHRDKVNGVSPGYGNTVLHRHPQSGHIYAFHGVCPLDQPDSEETRLCATVSEDGGNTWDWLPLQMDFPGTIINVGKVLEHRGMFLLPFHRNEQRHDLSGPRFRPLRPGDARDHGVLISPDLVHWSAGGFVPTRAEDDVFPHEGSLAVSQDDESEIVMVARTSTYHSLIEPHEPPVAFSSRTRDGGQTWSVAEAERELYNACNRSLFLKDAFGTFLYVYNPGPAWQRVSLRYKTKRPGEGWSDDRLFYQGPWKDEYPMMVEFAPGQFHVAWRSAVGVGHHMRAVRYGRFTMPEGGAA